MDSSTSIALEAIDGAVGAGAGVAYVFVSDSLTTGVDVSISWYIVVLRGLVEGFNIVITASSITPLSRYVKFC
jgi:hypothetical protein